MCFGTEWLWWGWVCHIECGFWRTNFDGLLSFEAWGINNTGIIRIQDRLTNTLTYSDNVSETLKGDGTYNNPNDYEVVSIISESLDNYGVATIEVVARYKVTGETANIIIKGYSDALILDVVSNSNSPSSANGTPVGGSKVSFMPIGTYTYRGYAENTLIYSSGEEIKETGRFKLVADFGNQIASLLADTGSLSYSDDNIIIDRQNGTFKGTNGTFDIPNGWHINTVIRGTFHGINAESVTGFSMGKLTQDNGIIRYRKTAIAGER